MRAQEEQVAFLQARGWEAKESERKLELLRESHRLSQSALMHLLGEDFGAAERDR